MHCMASQKSLDFVLLLLVKWTLAESLYCCGRDCCAGFILPSWMAALLGCVLHFCCHVVAGGHWGLFPPPPTSHWGRFRPSSTCQSLAFPESSLRLPDRLVYCGCCPFQNSSSMDLSAFLGSWMMPKVHTFHQFRAACFSLCGSSEI